MDQLSDYDYLLPESAIAQTPLANRAGSRLLVLDRACGLISHRRFGEVTELLAEGDVLVVNDTRVTAMKLKGQRVTGGKVELLLLRESKPGVFEAMAKPIKKLLPGDLITFERGLIGEIVARIDLTTVALRFITDSWNETLSEIGEAPLPPYIHEMIKDPQRYQTVYADEGGSAAAPTAGLHFTPDILSDLAAKGVQVAKVTLHVGLDTFRPVQTEKLSEHVMHGETCRISDDAAAMINGARGRVVAVGTTAVRTLESLAIDHGRVRAGTIDTHLFITPGFEFKVVDAMFTNFHLPKTTMLMMISAFATHESVFRTYREALTEGYRFLSFGDSMLIL